MKSNISCLIFDFDGVIADTDLGRFKVLKEILQDYDTKLSISLLKENFIGLSTKAFLTKYSPKLSSIEINEIVRKRHRLFFSNIHDYCIPFENMVKSIKYFNTKYDLAIVTTNEVENVKVLLKHLEIIDYFKWIIGRDKTENEKLEKTYKTIPSLLKKDVSECIVIEDSDFGVNAAKKEGFYCIRFDPENRLPKGIENEKVISYDELKKMIEKTRHANNV